jgi:flagellar hook-basal body complex protein FliE
MTIDAIRQIAVPQVPSVAAKPGVAGTGGFQSIFKDAIETVEQQRQDANATVDRFLSGENDELHQAAIATQQAELSFDLVLQVRNKVVQAYQEVMRMQV